jgi:hypothetical protein
MQNILIGRYDSDPEAQGLIKPEDGRWQLVIDKDGYPHLYVESTLEEEDGTKSKGMFLVEDMLPEGLTVKDLMDGGCFGGKLSPEEEAEAQLEYEKSRAASGIPCPR